MMTHYTTSNSFKRNPLTHRASKLYTVENTRESDDSIDNLKAPQVVFAKKKNRNLTIKKSLKDFVNKLYNPYVEKRKFKIELNENSNSIRKFVRKSVKDNFVIDRKQEEFNKITDQLFLYNNPSMLSSL